MPRFSKRAGLLRLRLGGLDSSLWKASAEGFTLSGRMRVIILDAHEGWLKSRSSEVVVLVLFQKC